ncbi:hypothetical protein F5880DRAFT_1190361 [Lentinula raphanica]|nr:hypothetical protein F5880DRAFT_1190361 [Lentinula raphanica]
MTRPLHILPLGIICVFLTSAISPEVLAAPTSFNSPGGDSRSGPIRSTATGLLEPVVKARDGLKVDDHVSSCLSSAGAGASTGADNSCRVSLDGNTAPQSLRILRRRAQSLDDPFSNTHAAGEHAPGQGGNLHSQCKKDVSIALTEADPGTFELSTFVLVRKPSKILIILHSGFFG